MDTNSDRFNPIPFAFIRVHSRLFQSSRPITLNDLFSVAQAGHENPFNRLWTPMDTNSDRFNPIPFASIRVHSRLSQTSGPQP
jgi:hypothetical protein